jgi:hypothetical protein
MEVRSVDAIHRHKLPLMHIIITNGQGGNDRRNTLSGPRFILGIASNVHTRRSSTRLNRRNGHERLGLGNRTTLGIVLRGWGAVPEPGRDERSFRPAVANPGEVPLDFVGSGVPVKLASEIDQRLGRGDVDVVNRREV